jgi:hypothetical protein
MRAGQRVQLKALPQVAEALKLAAPTAGTVLCSYMVTRKKSGRSELLDVRLDSEVTLWGVAAEAFEVSAPQQSRQS